MSLVAYGASDESETSDVDDAEVLPKSSNANSNVGKVEEDEDNDDATYDSGKISDEEDYVPTAVVDQNAASSSIEMNIPSQSVPAPTTLGDLPVPKSATLTSSPVQGEGEDELEEEVKPKAAQLADAPKPPTKKGKQPTRIVIPALKQDSDDEEEDKKRSKQQAPAGTGMRSGLFALLPPPVHGTKKETNRLLIPYTLTKRPTPSKTNQPASKGATPSSTMPATSGVAEADVLPSHKHRSAFNALTGYESDSDEEEGGPQAADGDLNFFSLGSEVGGASTSSEVSTVKHSEGGESSKDRILDSSDSSGQAATQSSSPPSSSQPSQAHASYSATESPVSSSTSVLLSMKNDSDPDSAAQSSMVVNSEEDDSNKSIGENEVSSTVGVPLFNQDAPLNFNSSVQGRSWSGAPLTSPMLPEMYAATSSSSGANYWQQHEHYAQDYSTEVEQDNSDYAPGSSGDSSFQQYMEDEQFLRISGKRKHKQEDIKIIDANVDDYVDPSDLMKGISEESSYQPHRKKDNMPSMQQKRKKQITYLAFQAKERELELKNAWSQSRMSKNQARSKYGF